MEGMLHFTGSEVKMRDFPATSITATHDGIGTRISISGPFLTGQRVQEISSMTKFHASISARIFSASRGTMACSPRFFLCEPENRRF